MTFANRNHGGSGRYARSLLASLQERDDVAMRVIAGPSRSNFLGTMRWLLNGARKALSPMPPDIIHCPSFVAPWAIPVPSVVTVHDAAARRFPGDHPMEWRVYDRVLMPGRLHVAARVITGSEFARRDVIAVYGLDPDSVVAIPNGLDARFFRWHSDPATADGHGALLFAGAPVGRKNLEAVFHCMAGASPDKELARVSLEISGALEEHFPHHSGLVRSLGLLNRVKWLGQVRDDEMPMLIARSRAVVYPSLYEGFGFPPLEAMAIGTPVVASNRGSLPEILNDAALLVDPTDERALGEALEAVLTRTELRERLRNAGRQQAHLYTWEKCATRTVEVYREVLRGIPRPC